MGLFEGLRNSTEQEKKSVRHKYVRCLIVGEDLPALLTYSRLRKTYGSEAVRIVAQEIPSPENLFPSVPSFCRGESGKAVMSRYPEVDTREVTKTSSFWKDQKFRSFGGRSRPEAIASNEEFFIDTSFVVEPRSFLDPLMYADEAKTSFHESVVADIIKGAVASVVRIDEKTAQGLARWRVELVNGTAFKVEQLFWCRPPCAFLKACSDKTSYPEKWIEFCQKTRPSKGVTLTLVPGKETVWPEETIFVPQSLTYDWGNFIGESFSSSGYKGISFFSYIEDDKFNPEDISKKIRLLKRSIERVFDINLAVLRCEEKIQVHEFVPVIEVDDTLYDEVRSTCEHLHFVGAWAPLHRENDSCSPREKTFGLARALMSVHQIENFSEPFIFLNPEQSAQASL